MDVKIRVAIGHLKIDDEILTRADDANLVKHRFSIACFTCMRAARVETSDACRGIDAVGDDA